MRDMVGNSGYYMFTKSTSVPVGKVCYKKGENVEIYPKLQAFLEKKLLSVCIV